MSFRATAYWRDLRIVILCEAQRSTLAERVVIQSEAEGPAFLRWPHQARSAPITRRSNSGRYENRSPRNPQQPSSKVRSSKLKSYRQSVVPVPADVFAIPRHEGTHIRSMRHELARRREDQR